RTEHGIGRRCARRRARTAGAARSSWKGSAGTSSRSGHGATASPRSRTSCAASTRAASGTWRASSWGGARRAGRAPRPVARRARRVRGPAKAELRAAAARIGGDDPVAERVAAALDPALEEALAVDPERHERVRSATFPVQVERERARFGAWYELFPRSWGGFAGVERRLARLGRAGLDGLYC